MWQQEAEPSGRDATAADGEAEDVMAAFEAAAAAVKAQREEATAALEDRVLRHIKSWCADWEADLERRPAEIKESGRGILSGILDIQAWQFTSGRGGQRAQAVG